MPTLRALCNAGRVPVEIVSQPSRPAGRGRHLHNPAVVEWALKEGLTVIQPRDVRDAAFLREMAALAPSVAVVVAFGQIFPKALLETPTRGCINLHASMLPLYRGAAPIQAAIIDGEASTGVTTMQMEEGLDSGPILLQEELAIGPRETAGELSGRLADIGAELMLRTLESLESDDIESRLQADAEATMAPRLRKGDGVLDWSQSAQRLFNRIRGVTPWPGASTQLRSRPLKILWGSAVEGASGSTGSEPGTYLGLIDARMAVSCGNGTVLGVERVQRPGRKPLEASQFVNGEPIEVGERFG
ncbi:MAG: methionyl-tRNA formyltransferase [Nitrospirae bacterium]|nr:methionyl-tRNA formyltransferase [Nitrospirota bacterium]